ncbi:MAG: MarR family winged helix-turn-helix transcriptional regulator [Stackebrandtia sp.]
MTGNPRWLDEEEQRTWRAFLWASQLTQAALERQLQRDWRMPHAYYMILAMLSEAPGRLLTMTELARMTLFSPSRLSHAVNKLERNGWVARQRHLESGRTTVATLTDAGFNALRQAAPGHVEQVRASVLEPLSKAEQRQLRSACEKLLANLREDED